MNLVYNIIGQYRNAGKKANPATVVCVYLDTEKDK